MKKSIVLATLSLSLLLSACGTSPAPSSSAVQGADTSSSTVSQQPSSVPAQNAETSSAADPNTASQSGSYTFTDALGKEITVDNPQRVVVLMGSFAEAWILAGGELVGTTEDAVTERGLELDESVQMVGNVNEIPSAEKIIALNPDLVILSSERASNFSHLELQPTLEDAGIPCAFFSVTHFPEYLDMLYTFTRITGKHELYDETALTLKTEVDEIISAADPGEEPPSVLMLITHSRGALARGSDTMTGNMLKELGAVNIVDENPSLLSEFSVEKIITTDPDYIFVIPTGYTDDDAKRVLQESVENDPAWSSLTAVQEGRYIILDRDLFLYKPNMQWAESYRILSEALYGTN